MIEMNIYCDWCGRSGGPQPLADIDAATNFWSRRDWLVNDRGYGCLCPYCNDERED